MRKSDCFIAFILICLSLLTVALVHAQITGELAVKSIELRTKMVRYLGLTDLSLFTEARYTRHPSQADHHTPFQDHPMSLEHFPTGSIVSPPPMLRRGY